LSLRLRLTAVYLLLLVPALVLLSVAVYFLSRERTYDAVDENLRAKAQAVESALEHVLGPITETDIEQARNGLDRQALEGAVFQLRSPDGSVAYSSLGVGRELPETRIGVPATGFATEEVLGTRTRILVEPVVRVGALSAFIESRTSLQLADQSIADIRNVLGVGVALIVVATAVPAYVVAGRAIDPVRQVSRLAKEIERTADFTRRLPLGGADSEMRELTATFNAMIDRVDKMIQAQRAFLADSSHEMRRPLTILRTNIDVINDPRLTEAERRAIEEEMREEAEAMSRLISELLLLSREGRPAVAAREVDLSALAERVWEAARTAHPRHLFLKEIEPGIVLEGDSDHLERALANLLQNAALYTPGQGRISLKVRRENTNAVLDVADTGIGMSAEDAEHAFDRFYRGAGAHAIRTDGFGLGLAIVKLVVDAHGGSVSVSSRLGQGTTFTVSLPLAKLQLRSTEDLVRGRVGP